MSAHRTVFHPDDPEINAYRLLTGLVVFGAVTAITVVADALVDGLPSMDRLRPVSRLGGPEWGRPPEVFRMRRPTSPADVL